MNSSSIAPGRPRDSTIDDDVLDAALVELAKKGYGAFSLTAVAQAAGTTRPAIYRRWKDKPSLIVDAVARLAQVDPPAVTEDPYSDLVAELEHFAHCISAAGVLPLAGLMLSDGLDPHVRASYLELIVGPRRERLRRIFAAGRAAGDLTADADVEIAASFLTGSWYSFHVAGRAIPADWARRVADLVWRSCAVGSLTG